MQERFPNKCDNFSDMVLSYDAKFSMMAKILDINWIYLWSYIMYEYRPFESANTSPDISATGYLIDDQLCLVHPNRANIPPSTIQ